MTVDGCHAMGANGWCRAFMEGDGCRMDIRRVDMCARVQLNWYLCVISLEANEVVGANAKLNSCGNVANARRGEEFDLSE